MARHEKRANIPESMKIALMKIGAELICAQMQVKKDPFRKVALQAR